MSLYTKYRWSRIFEVSSRKTNTRPILLYVRPSSQSFRAIIPFFLNLSGGGTSENNEQASGEL